MDGRGREDQMLLTREEETSLSLLEPLVAHHLDVILETFSLQLVSDPSVASLLEDDLAVDRLKRSQQRYVLSLLKAKPPDMDGRDRAQAVPYRDPFGLGASWHLRTMVHFITAVQPLVHEAFGDHPSLHRLVWNAMLKVIFHDIELMMAASLRECDGCVEAARREEGEANKILDFMLNQHEADENQHLSGHVSFMEEVTFWRANVCRLAREMGNPLGVILGHAESLLKKTTTLPYTLSFGAS